MNSPINQFLLQHGIRLAQNPCISPDFCLDWPALSAKLVAGAPVKTWAKSAFETAEGVWTLLEDEATGDSAWRLEPRATGAAVHVLDSGAGFRHISILPPDLFSESGRGLFIVSALTHDFRVSKGVKGGSHDTALRCGDLRSRRSFRL